jgi:subtilisin family serine protease
MPVYLGGTFAEIAQAIDVAVAGGAHVLSNSWGWVGAPSPAIASAIRRALDAGVAVLFAAGNGPDRPPFTYDTAFPCNLTATTDLICVGASSPTDEHKGSASSDGSTWWGSSYIGSGPDVVAPSPWSYTTDRQT